MGKGSRFASNRCHPNGRSLRCWLIGLALAAIVFPLPCAALDTEGKAPNLHCSKQAMEFVGDEITPSRRTYKFSGPCTIVFNDTYASNEDPNFSYTIRALWDVSGKWAGEIFETRYNTITAIYNCDFDPWLEPEASCSQQSVTQSRNDVFGMLQWYDYEEMGSFPVSRTALSANRIGLVERAMARSIKVIDPTQGKEYAKPSDVIVSVTMEKVVQNPPARLVAIALNEMMWPEPGKTPRAFSDAKNFVNAPTNLLAFFPMSDKNLWGASWAAKAHLVAADPFWTPDVIFKVGAAPGGDGGQALGPPPEAPPGIKILSPTPNQVVSGDLLLKVLYVNLPGANEPVTTFQWFWYPPSQPGEWPKPPEQRYPLQSWAGHSETVIDRSKFTEHGRWSVRASTGVAENKIVSDEVQFIVFDKLALLQEMKAAPAVQAVEQQTPFPVQPVPAGMPLITEPLENQKIAAPGAVPLAVRLAAEEADLRWEVEWKSFGDTGYARLAPQVGGLRKMAGGDLFSCQVRLEQPGTYRLRVQSLQPGALWSPWRTVVVGTPPPLKKSMPAVVEKKVLTAPAAKLRTATEAGGAAQTPASGATIQNQPVVQPANPLLPKVKLQSAGPAVR